MKILNSILLILALVTAGKLYGQTDSSTVQREDTVRSGTIKIEKKYTEADFFPHVNGKFTGPINPFELCSSSGIQTNSGIVITSFELHTFDGSGDEVKFSINGNVLPKHLCEELAKFQEGEVFYIRNIKGLGRYGEKLHLNPIRFTISYQ